MKNLLFEIIMSKQCNKRCNYCDLDFKNENLDNLVIDEFYNKLNWILQKNDNIFINFFGWEPLLNYTWIKYFLTKFNEIQKIKYSIGTNWALLNNEILDFFYKYNVEINLSIDSKNINDLNLLNIVKNYKWKVNINFIIEPSKINFLNKNLENLKIFKNINLMPVYATLDRNNDQLNQFYEILNYIYKSFIKINLQFFPYYKGQTNEKQFILDVNGDIFWDIDSLLYLQKQYKILPKILRNQIENNSKLWNIFFNNLDDILDKNDILKIEKIVLNIPKIILKTQTNQKLETLNKKALLSKI